MSEPTDIKTVKKIIALSGNSFHCDVLKYLHDEGWSVLISPFYTDNITNKPREIDLIAEKAFKANNSFGDIKGTINVKLFIECKYISQKTVFWYHDKDKQEAEGLVIRKFKFRNNNIHTSEHHYLNGVDRVAKLFADERKQSSENELFYKALNQSLNAMVYYRNKNSIIKSPGKILKTVNYPVIICNSFENLYKVEIGVDADPLNIAENFLLEVNYAYRISNEESKNEYFLIDIVDFKLIEDFLKSIRNDANLVSFFLP